jgi:cell wall-associated NlpC family hydrolase
MKGNLAGLIFVGLAAVAVLTIAKTHDDKNSVVAKTVDFDSIIMQADTTNEHTNIIDIDTQTLGMLGADVYGLDEIEIPTKASVEEAINLESEEENEYADLAIANVTNYVNVRSNPDTQSEIVGKIYNGAVAQVLSTAGENNDWFQVVSGNVEGYIKAEFFIYGDDAAAVIDNYVTRYAVVIADRLNVREEPNIESKRIGYIDNGEKVKLIENQGQWLKVEYTSDKIGYVATEYVNITEEFIYAKTIAEEQAEIAASKVLEERQNVSEETVSEDITITVTPPAANYSSSTELRNSIVQYSMQFLGNKYVHGGQSLVTGTDCSGFTSLIYKEFGYSISRTPAGQLSSSGRSISYDEIQPGDIICYGSSRKCTHVALYIGNGQIIHSANSKKGVVIYNADYDTILGVKNIID